MIDCCMSPPIYSHPFEHIPSLFSFSSIAQLDKLCVYIGGFIPSFIYYCNIHSFITAIILLQSTFLSSFLRVQCILYIENIPRQVMISSYKVRHQHQCWWRWRCCWWRTLNYETITWRGIFSIMMHWTRREEDKNVDCGSGSNKRKRG